MISIGKNLYLQPDRPPGRFNPLFPGFSPNQAKLLNDSQATEEGVSKLVRGNNKFAFDLYKNLAHF